MSYWSPKLGLGAIFLDSLNLSIFLDKHLWHDKPTVDRLTQEFEAEFGMAAIVADLEQYRFLYNLLSGKLFFAFLRRQTQMPNEFFSYVAEQLDVPFQGR